MTTPTVFIVDDEPDTCSALSWLLESVELKTQIYHDGNVFLEEYTDDMRGCLLLDMRMPHISGLEVQQHIKEKGYTLPIIFLTAHGDVPLAVRALKEGAMDFILKPFNAQILLDTIQRAIKRDEILHEVKNKQRIIDKRIKSLTPRELEVMELVIAGHRSKIIAAKLHITLKTVELYRARIMDKLQVSSSVELTNTILTYRHAEEHIEG